MTAQEDALRELRIEFDAKRFDGCREEHWRAAYAAGHAAAIEKRGTHAAQYGMARMASRPRILWPRAGSVVYAAWQVIREHRMGRGAS